MKALVGGSFFLPWSTLIATGMAYDTPRATTDLEVVSYRSVLPHWRDLRRDDGIERARTAKKNAAEDDDQTVCQDQ